MSGSAGGGGGAHEEEEVTSNKSHKAEAQPQPSSANAKLRRFDSLDLESRQCAGANHLDAAKNGGDWWAVLFLAFQSIGVVYGDIGTSPLYVYSSTFTDGIKHNDDILGVLSLIFYTLTLIPLLKYVFIVLRANDNGDGGTFAMYSLICRYAKVGMIPSEEASDQDVSTFNLQLPNNTRVRMASCLKSHLEKSHFAKFFLLFATMLGTSMVIGDGILTPCISVLSAVGGIKEATDAMTEGRIVFISVVILVVLFMLQRLGTDKVGYTFAPIILVWFAFIAGIGVFNFIKYDPSVVKAINPAYIFHYFTRNKKDAWISLGGVVLATTGTEALFADVGHFSVRSIQLSMCTVTYPALILAYTGQASFLRKHNLDVSDTFFKSIPGTMYWPMFVLAVLAAIIASQAMISGTFSIIQQSLALGCFPRVKIIHTSTKFEGQVYIPEVNYLLMLACIAVTVGFRNTIKLGNAYGIAVVFVMTLTSAFLVLIMIMIWKTNIFLVIAYVVVVVSVEILYLSSVLYKFNQGGYLPLVFAMVLMFIMFVWNTVYRKKYYFELENKVSPDELKEMVADNKSSRRIPGLAIFYSELVHGIPPIFKHYVENVPAVHSVLVFVSIKSLAISKVPVEERFLFRRVKPNDLKVFRCVVRYGYTDVRNEEEPFEGMLVERLKDFVRKDWMFSDDHRDAGGAQQEEEQMDIEVLDRAWKAGVVHLVGEHEIVAAKGASIWNRLLINYAYNFLTKNVRQTNKVFDIPHKRMLKYRALQISYADTEQDMANGRKLSWGHCGSGSKNGGDWWSVWHLAFQSIGVVYGDIGTSPLYVYSSTFTGGIIKHNDDILGVLSLIFYTLTLISLLKYIFIVLRANHNGDGGTFAMYSLICRYARVGLIPSEETSDKDEDVSVIHLELPNTRRIRIASCLKSHLEKSKFAKFFLLFAAMLGTSMVIGDGVLTPCISVLSAVGGIKEATDAMSEGRIVLISVTILVCLFTFQRLGTDKVGYTFAPIILIWFTSIAGIGLYNFIKYDPAVAKAVNPAYIVDYFRRNKKDAWISLGGVVLATTGTEALFADVGHFSVRSIQISMCTVTYPALILAYTGQASFLRKHNLDVSDTFFKSVPGTMYWPMFVISILAAIISSQAMISGTFSIIQQSLSLGCFPRVKIVHTSTKYEGQIYIPEINYLLMLACVAVTIGFRSTTKIGNAYGMAVVSTMALTSAFLVLIMIMIWKTNLFLVIAYVVIIGSVEILYLSSVLYKFDQGGYLPLAFAMVLLFIMFVWNDVYRKKYYFELDNKVSLQELKEIVEDTNSKPGVAFFYSELLPGIPPIFKHYVENIPALHSVLVFISLKPLPISKVPAEERFLFQRVRPNDLKLFRCVVRYGYSDVPDEEEANFEGMLLESLKDFVRKDRMFRGSEDENIAGNEGGERDTEALERAWRGGVAHLVGENEVVAGKGGSLWNRIEIDYAYNFLRRNFRESNGVFGIPHKRILKVGMTYEL